MLSVDLFLSAFVSLFVIADPFGTAAVFSVLTKNIERAEQRGIALKAAMVAIGVLIGFSLAGNALLSYMHISLPAFRVAGGLLLFVTAFRMVMGFHDPQHLESGGSAYRDRSDIAVFPMAIPLLAGPGCITATLMFSTSAKNMVQHAEVWAAIISVELIALAVLMTAPHVGRVLGRTGNGIIARIMGILLTALAVQFIADGIGQLELF
jgi:multiple antibiotic resistance protein